MAFPVIQLVPTASCPGIAPGSLIFAPSHQVFNHLDSHELFLMLIGTSSCTQNRWGTICFSWWGLRTGALRLALEQRKVYSDMVFQHFLRRVSLCSPWAGSYCQYALSWGNTRVSPQYISDQQEVSELASSPCSVTWMNMRRWNDVKNPKILFSVYPLSQVLISCLKTNKLPKILSSSSASDAETLQNQHGWRLCCFWKVCSIQESTLTDDTQFCAGKNDAMSVFCYTLIHAGIRQADVRYHERALL